MIELIEESVANDTQMDYDALEFDGSDESDNENENNKDNEDSRSDTEIKSSDTNSTREK